jgi:hypothetical protein
MTATSTDMSSFGSLGGVESHICVSDVTKQASNWAEARAWKKQSSSSSAVEGTFYSTLTLPWFCEVSSWYKMPKRTCVVFEYKAWSEKVPWFLVLRSIIMIWFLVLHSIMMILWSDLKSEMKRLNFCVVCNEFYAFHVCIAWMIVERIHGSILFCYVHSIYDFFYLWLGQISIVEAGAITSNLFSSWAGADHSAPCWVAPAITCLLGTESDGLCCRTSPRCHYHNDRAQRRTSLLFWLSKISVRWTSVICCRLPQLLLQHC